MPDTNCEPSQAIRRIFLSYGHDQHAAFVRQVKQDLEAAGYDAWLDASIQPGQFWETAIEQGIDAAEAAGQRGLMLFFMTPHSVREGSVCRDEVYAARKCDLRVLPIMLESCEPPLLVQRIQWLDMRDCVPLKANRERYAARLAALLQALESPGSSPHLGRPGVFVARPRARSLSADEFVDRDREVQDLKARLAQHRCHLAVVVGPPGIGKSALVSQICDWIDAGEATGVAERAIYLDCDELIGGRQSLSLFSIHLHNLLSEKADREGFLEQWSDWARRPDRDLPIPELVDLLGRFRRPSLLVMANLELLLDSTGHLEAREHAAFLVKLIKRDHRLRILATSTRLPVIEGVTPGEYVVWLTKGLNEADSVRLLRQSASARRELGRSAGTGRALGDDAHLAKAAQRVSGYPFWLRQIVGYLDLHPTETLKSLLADPQSLFQEDGGGPLMNQSFNALAPAELQVLQALSIFDRPENQQAVSRVLPAGFSPRELRASLNRFVLNAFIDFDDTTGTYRILSLWQDYVRFRLPEDGPFSAAALHRRAAEYYAELLADFDYVEREPGAYLHWHCMLSADWQERVAAWLGHLAQAGDPAHAQIAVAGMYLRSFWYWGGYITFPFCERLLGLLRETESLEGGAVLLDLLERFRSAWPELRHHRDDDVPRGRWLDVRRSLEKLRAFLRCDGPAESLADDGERMCVRVLTDALLARAATHLGDGMAVAYYREALALIDHVPDLRWSVPWLLYYLGGVLAGQAQEEDAVSLLRQAWDKVEEADREIQANITRLLGDLAWRRGETRRSWLAYQLASYYAYLFQGRPSPTAYTVAYYGETAERIAGLLSRQHLVDPPGSLLAAAEMAAFWQTGWEILGARPEAPDAATLAAWLAEPGQPSLIRYLLPPIPVPGDTSFAETVSLVQKRMAGRVETLVREVVP